MANTNYINALLDDCRDGNRQAIDHLFPLVYRELRKIASEQLTRESSVDTISPTALVNEAFLNLIDEGRVRWRDRKHFLAMCSTAMRHILVNYAQASQQDTGTQETEQPTVARRADKLLALDEALTRLSRFEARMARVVELHFFGGLNEADIANVLNINEKTARHDWYKARALLSLAIADRQQSGRSSSKSA